MIGHNTLLHIADVANGCFEGGGAFFAWLNVRRILKDRGVEGVDWRTTAFFGAWGVFNLFLYPFLGMWLSAAAGGAVAVANFTWVRLALRFTRP